MGGRGRNSLGWCSIEGRDSFCIFVSGGCLGPGLWLYRWMDGVALGILQEMPQRETVSSATIPT